MHIGFDRTRGVSLEGENVRGWMAFWTRPVVVGVIGVTVAAYPSGDPGEHGKPARYPLELPDMLISHSILNHQTAS